MSLNFYADAELTLPITGATPKRFLFPNAGSSQPTKVWLGDPYTSICTATANPGDNVINLSDTSGFLSSSAIAITSSGHATAVSGIQQFTYTGKTQDQLTGVTGITSVISADSLIHPNIVYYGVGGANISVLPSGPDIQNYGIAISMGSTTTLGFPGLPAIFTQTQLSVGVSNALEVFLSVKMPAGVDQVFTNFGVQSNNLYLRDISDTTSYVPTEGAYGPFGNMYAYRHDEWLPIPIRLLPINRKVQADLPGFVVGKYRWRDESTRNATALVPTNWNINPQSLGAQFVSGMGDQDDLAPIQLQQDGNSVRVDVNSGEYFTGVNRYYLPANPILEFLPASIANANIDGTVTLQLSNTPLPTTPIFIGTYALDSQGFYETFIQYRYESTLVNPDGSPRTDLPKNYFTLNRATNQVILNIAMAEVLVYLGLVSGQPNDYFNLNIYPVDNIDTIYINQGANAPYLYTSTWTFNKSTGTVVVPSIPGALVGEPVFGTCSPAVAVLYDIGNSTGYQEITTVDLNPAFSGLSSGYFYLQHTKQTPASLVLACDKPIIPIPATQSSIIGLVAYGPVYFTNDYALLKVTAYGALDNEPIPNAVLDVVVNSATFTGSINYEDPVVQTVSVITGGDGSANMIFIPKPGYGIYLPTTPAGGGFGGLATTSVTNDTLVLPLDIPISQLWNVQEGWLVNTYYVLNNDPLLGMVGAIPSLGEVPWATVGTPGTVGYRTNGQLQIWTNNLTSEGQPIFPINVLDINGHSFTSALFNGNVHSIVYPGSIPTSTSVLSIGSYFITYIQRVLVRMKLENSDLFSNSILLQMQPPAIINDNPWLILDDAIQGILNQFRLGFVPGKSNL